MSSLFDLEHITAYRGHSRALRDLSIKIDYGESLAILGPNGCGKSTLLKVFSREIHPVDDPQSSMSFLGKSSFVTADFHKSMGIVSNDLQNSYNANAPGLEVVISGFFNSISLWAFHQVESKHISKAKNTMEELGISDLSDRPYGELSTGQQRRLLLARALVKDPAALILDEPYSGLDIGAKKAFQSSVDATIHSGKSVILVTHQVEDIHPLIQRTVLLKSGSILFDGDTEGALSGHRLRALYGCAVRVEIDQNGKRYLKEIG